MPLPAPFSATSNSLRAPSHQRAIGGMFWVQGVLGDGGREPPSCSPSRREGVMEPGVLSVMEGGAQIQRTMSTVVGRGPWNACGSWPRAGNRPSWVQMGRVWLWAGSPGTSWRSTEPSFTGWRDTSFPWPFVAGLLPLLTFREMPPVGDIYQIKRFPVLFPEYIDNSLCG